MSASGERPEVAARRQTDAIDPKRKSLQRLPQRGYKSSRLLQSWSLEGGHMQRRDVIAGLLATTAASALQAAEQNKVRRLAACSQNLIDFSTPPWAWLFDRLQQMGFAEGKNLIIDRYATEGRPDSYAEVARNIVQANPDVI